jgi:OmpA-OmpF porin, OOP family
MRLRAIAFATAALGAVAAGAWTLADAAAAYVERQTRDDLAAAFAAAGHDWASVTVDGLVVGLHGTAPDETSRFRVIEIARRAVDAARLQDAITVASASPAAAPAFALEVMRNDEAASLIGLVPAEGARDAIAEGLAAAGLGATVTDMLATADHAAPEGWEPALAFGLGLLGELTRAKVAIAPGRVAVAATAESEAAIAPLRRRIEEGAPPGVALEVTITAPRPVISPFAVGLRRDPDGTAQLIACSAESEEEAAIILAAARDAGLDGTADCRLGLGAPTPDWAEAAARGFAAVAEMGGGTFTLRNLDAVLTGPPDHDPADLAATGAALGEALPAVFSLATRGASTVETDEGPAVVYAPEFRATLLADGSVRLAGPVADRTAQIAVVGFAEALFGHERVMNTTVIDSQLPEGWPGRVLAGIEGLALLNEGTLAVTPEATTVSGTSHVEEAEAELATFFAAKGDDAVALDIAFDPQRGGAPPRGGPPAHAGRPRARGGDRRGDRRRRSRGGEATARAEAAEACAAAIEAILDEETILFETGSATIDDASADVIAAIAETLRDCPDARFEIAGHTDSSGRAAVNQTLSEARAAAVLEALAAEEIETAGLQAVGYGPDRPIADNDTPEGRALNRRIEFALLPDDEARTTRPSRDEAADEAPDDEAEATAEADGGADDPD